MALLWADSFDTYGTSPNNGKDAMLAGIWAEATSNGGVTSGGGGGRTGSLSYEFLAVATQPLLRRVVTPVTATVGVGYGLFLASLPNTNNNCQFQFLAASAIATIAVNTDGSLILRNGGSAGTIIASSDPVLVAGAWNHVEIKLVRDATAGSCEIRVNGNVVMLQTGINFGATNPTSFQWFKSNTNIQNAWRIDDVMAWDSSGSENNTFIGPARVALVFPGATTAENDWVANTGTPITAVSEVPPNGDTSYISALAAGDRSEFTIATLPSEILDIKAVYVQPQSKIAAAGVGNLQVSLVSNASVAAGANRPLTPAYTYWPDIFPLNPDGNIPWTRATLQAAKIRIDKTV